MARWWATLDEDDPISLEPLAKLAYPPFSLRNLPEPEPEAEQREGDLPERLERNTECHPRKFMQAQKQQHSVVADCVTHFDGRVLAHYLASTLSFVHPITRRELTLSECEELDDYLKVNHLGRPRVVQAFKRQDSPPQQRTMATSDIDLQAESAALLQSLFSSSRRAPVRAGRNMSAMRNARRLQAAVMNLRPAVTEFATADEAAGQTEETTDAGLLVRSESARDPQRPTVPSSSTIVQAGDQGMMQYPTLYGRCPSQRQQHPKGSWCAPVLTSASGVVDVARDFPTLSSNRGSSKQPTQVQQRWGKRLGPRRPLTMADLLAPGQ